MTSCDDFELELERLAGGSLSAERQAPLAAHVLTCERCRRYQAAVADTTAALRAIEVPPWDAIRERVVRDFRRERTELAVTTIALAVLLGPILFWAAPALGVGVLAYICLVWWFWSRRSAARGQRVLAPTAPADFFEAARQDLDGEIKRLRWSSPILAGCLAVMLPGAFFEFSDPRWHVAAALSTVVMGAVTLAVTLWNRGRLRQARAQRLELDGRRDH